jgi:hypothetical protein
MKKLTTHTTPCCISYPNKFLYYYDMMYFITTKYNILLGKGKVHPVTCHEGTKEEYRYSCALFFNLGTVLEGDGWLTLHPLNFSPRNDPVSIVQEAG